jgi:hypothetical protein
MRWLPIATEVVPTARALSRGDQIEDLSAPGGSLPGAIPPS